MKTNKQHNQEMVNDALECLSVLEYMLISTGKVDLNEVKTIKNRIWRITI